MELNTREEKRNEANEVQTEATGVKRCIFNMGEITPCLHAYGKGLEMRAILMMWNRKGKKNK